MPQTNNDEITEDSTLNRGASGHTRRSPTRGLVVLVGLAFVIAAVALATAAWAVKRADESNSARSVPFGDAEKASLCEAFNTVRDAISVRTRTDLGPDPVAVQAVGANARLAMSGGGAYLLARISPAEPAPLEVDVRAFALNLQDIAMNALAGLPNEDTVQTTRLKEAEDQSTEIAAQCQ